MRIRIYIRNILLILSFIILNGPGVTLPQENAEKARRFTRSVEFDYLNWTLGALWQKATRSKPAELDLEEQKAKVYAYLNLVKIVQELDGQVSSLYANPTIENPTDSSKAVAGELALKQEQLKLLTPLVETILQEHIKTILLEEDLNSLSILFPPVIYCTSDVPLSLLLSPRDRIQLDANISLKPGLSENQIVRLENYVERKLNVSALIEEVGGMGTYPSMIMLTTDLNWLVETISHEWVHNYLALHSLGINYDTTPELRTMNETTATLAGKEIGEKVIARFFPERVPPPPVISQSQSPAETSLPAFDFREEMRITRDQVDRLLAAGKIQEAEDYMKIRQRIFWNNGYLIRRINQAYFAFHGAYNDTPGGGASGADQVGPAVVLLRERCGSLGVFLKHISAMSSYDQLKRAVTDDCD